MIKIEIINTKQAWIGFRNKLTGPCLKLLNASLARLVNRAAVTCLFDVSELKFGVAYCYNGANDEPDKRLVDTVVASAFIDATSELSANDIAKNIGITKNEPIPTGKASGTKTSTKKTIKVTVGK